MATTKTAIVLTFYILTLLNQPVTPFNTRPSFTAVQIGHTSTSPFRFTTNPPLQATNKNNDAQEEAKQLREKAEKMRKEISAFQNEKDAISRSEQQERERVVKEKNDERMRYSAEVPILKGDGSTVMERVDFRPRISGGKSLITVCQAELPLGIILGEHEQIPGAIRVDEVTTDSNAGAVGVQEGDLLRAVTACEVRMETPTWQLIVGGIGQPKTKRMMYSTDGRPFEEVMDAVGSNRMDPEERAVWLVLERLE